MGTATQERPTTIENIKVLQVGKFGVRVDEKTWFGVNAPLTPQHFSVGEGYKVSVTTSKTSKKYICEILGQEVKDSETAAALAAAVPDAVKDAEAALAKAKAEVEAKAKAAVAAAAPKASTTNPTRAGFGQPLTDYDMQVQRQISRAGIYQAALQSGGALQWATSLDEYLSNVRKIADAGMKYVQE